MMFISSKVLSMVTRVKLLMMNLFFRGAATLIFDLTNTATLKHVIAKPILDKTALSKGKYIVNQERAKMQYRCQFGDYSMLTGIAAIKEKPEPLAAIHNINNDVV